MKANPILLEVFKNRFAAVSEEMGVTLIRTAFSPNIKERRDLSCAVFSARGDMIAQAAHIPVHLGSMPLSVKSAIEAAPMGPGDMAALNDPFKGGTHLPDITLVAPVFCGQGTKPAFYVANRAHHADVGGMSAGSMPLSSSIFQEGVIIPPLLLVRAGEADESLMRLILSQSRTPEERRGDFAAQIMANMTGVKRLVELAGKYGEETLSFYGEQLINYAEILARAAIREIPDGTYAFEDVLDGDGQGAENIPIRLTLAVDGEEAILDFRESGDQVRGCLNAVRSITVSACLYVFRALMTGDAPANAGILAPLRILTRPGSILDARFPAAVAGGNVETSQRVADVVLGALAKALPGRVPAASQGTMNNLAMGGLDPRTGRPFAYYETLAGGMGASLGQAGESAVHSHMTNTLNTPVEALEYACPFRVRAYGLRRGSGGEGRFPGGNGLVREIELLGDCEATVLSERRTSRPYGLAGGLPGAAGRNLLTRDGETTVMPGKFQADLRAGDVLRVETPGGGGYGAPDSPGESGD